MKRNAWFEKVKEYTEKLVAIRGISPGEGEKQVAQEVLQLLYTDGLQAYYTESGFDALAKDPWGRQNVYALLKGESSRTIVLLGHFDVVDTKDYGVLEALALQPRDLESKKQQLVPAAEQGQNFDEWMFGRGVADMKSGVAVNIALIRRFAEESQQASLSVSVLMIATPDEENESAGVLQAVQLLLRLREQYDLQYVGVLNTDYVTSVYPGDTHKYIYAGSIGKLLPTFFCVGQESHAGDPFKGLDANLLAAELIRDLSMNDELCEEVPGQLSAPPVSLKATDLKDHYDVQLPLVSYFYLNLMALKSTPQEMLARLCARAEEAMGYLLARVDATEQRWRARRGEQGWQERFRARHGIVLTYAQLYEKAVEKFGEEYVRAELRDEWLRYPDTIDRRERSVYVTQRLWKVSQRQGPAVVIFYAPPYYPAVPPVAGALQEAVDAVVKAHPEIELDQQPYFPYLSDMSYLYVGEGLDLRALQANMPVWQGEGMEDLPGAYTLPLAEIQRLNLPVINWGPFGRGAHQRDEAVYMPYAFEELPQLLYEVIERL